LCNHRRGGLSKGVVLQGHPPVICIMINSGYDDLLERIEGLHSALASKEQANASLVVQKAALERELRVHLTSKEQDVVLLQQVRYASLRSV